jgi:hypothetical protein
LEHAQIFARNFVLSFQYLQSLVAAELQDNSIIS